MILPLLLGFLLVMLILGAALLLLPKGSSDPEALPRAIPKGVTVGGVNVGGMTRQAAHDAVLTAFPADCETTDMVLELPNRKHALSPADTGAHWDVEGALDEAFRAAPNTEIALHFQVDEAYIRQRVDTILEALGGVYVPSCWNVDGEMPDLQGDGPCQTLVLAKGHSGITLDVEELIGRILDSYRSGIFRVSVKDIGTTLEPAPLDLDAIYAELYIAPAEPALNRETMEATPGRNGYGFDLEQARTALAEAPFGEVLFLPMARIAPQLGDDDVYFQDVLGQCRTPHSDNENRNVNLALACAAIDGRILQPGETISYNEALGKRTTQAGYLPAPAYSGTELVDEVGGGICQVSSTLYLSSLLAELKIVERQNHGFPVDYIPIGLDATVNWGTTDLKIRNNQEYPIRIRATVDDEAVLVQILGIDTRDYYVRIEHRVEGPRYASAYLCHYDPETDKEIYRTLDHASLYLDVVWQWPDYADNERIVTYR